MQLWTFAFFNLTRRPLRSALTVLGIAIAVGSFVAMVGLSQGIERAWVDHLTSRGTHLLAMQKGAIAILTTSIDAEVGNRIGATEGVVAVAGELIDMMTVENQMATMATGWPSDSFLWNTLTLEEGRLPVASETGSVVIGQGAARNLGKKPGDSLRLRDRTFSVAGVFRAGDLTGNNSVIMPLGVMQEMMARPGKVTAFNVRAASPKDPAKIASTKARLERSFPGLTFVETRAVGENDLVLRTFRAIGWSFSLIAIVIALVITLNTLLMAVIERTREIGILSTVGWQSSRIVKLLIAEGLSLSLLGGMCGIAIGAIGLAGLAHLPQVQGFVEPSVTPALLVQALGATLLLGILGSAYPAWRAARMDAVEALRYQ